MFDLSKLPETEQQAVRKDVQQLYYNAGGEDIERAIKRDRKVLELHERELDHVSTLPLEQNYRWRVAPGIALRAQKDLERQKHRRADLMNVCVDEVVRARGHAEAATTRIAAQPDAAALKSVEKLSTQFAQAIEEFKEWSEQNAESPPPDVSAAA